MTTTTVTNATTTTTTSNTTTTISVGQKRRPWSTLRNIPREVMMILLMKSTDT